MNTKHITFLIPKDATLLDITGPYEVFSQAIECINSRGKKPPYILHTVSAERSKAVRTASGMVIECDSLTKDIDYEIDTLFIPGVPNSIQADYKMDRKVLKWIARQSEAVRRICSVCTGTFFLAEAGILNGKKATTHWELCDTLTRHYPQTEVQNDPIFVKDGNIYTSAGISTGMDLALALVEEDFGRSLALEVAKQMVLYLKRPGNQSQYSSVLTHQSIDYRPIQEIGNWIMEHLNQNMTVEALAEQVSMSPRNFARVFLRETGVTPARYIDKLRIETACRYLVETQLSLKEIAGLCGLSSPDNMRRVFLKYMQITPSDYRENFGTAFDK
ncbi:MAG: GlxA family transcriptional regulator [Dysgonomonas sp.]|nr:GlxA family transcriptional regulator [Dysgonomonas sp.]